MFKKILFGAFAVFCALCIYAIAYPTTFYTNYANFIRDNNESNTLENLIKLDNYYNETPVFAVTTDDCTIEIYEVVRRQPDSEDVVQKGFFFLISDFSENVENSIPETVEDMENHKTSIVLGSGDKQFIYPHDLNESNNSSNDLESWITQFDVFPMFLYQKDINKYLGTVDAEGVKTVEENQNIEYLDSIKLVNAVGETYYQSGDLSAVLNYTNIDAEDIKTNGVAPYEDSLGVIFKSDLVKNLVIAYIIFVLVFALFGYLLFKPKNGSFLPFAKSGNNKQRNSIKAEINDQEPKTIETKTETK